MITSSDRVATADARLASSKPVVSSVTRMPSSRKKLPSRLRSLCISGSPPDTTTCATPSLRNESRCRSRSLAVTSVASWRFQMSHITQRQLQRLWAFSTRIGMLTICSPSPASTGDFSEPCCTDMPHPLAAKFDLASQCPLRLAEQTSQRRSYPPQLRFHLQRLQLQLPFRKKPSGEVLRQKLHSSADHHQLDIPHCEAGKCLGR